MSGNNGTGGTGDAEFDAFEAAGQVEVGDTNLASQGDDDAGDDDADKDKKPAAKRGPPKMKETASTGEEDDDADKGGEDEDDAGEGGEDEDDEDKKPKKTAAENQIERLKREKRELHKQLREARAGGNTELIARLEKLEKGLSGENDGDTKTKGKPAPDPSDADKYPLGHLDDRYIEDKLEWLAEQKAAEKADSVLQRQQENERTQAQTAAAEALLEKVDELSIKGSELFDDFQEEVVEAGMRGDWPCGQATFEAAYEAENGAQILYNLSQDTKEARRVANLSPYQQMRYVQEQDAEIAAKGKPRTKPKAGEPPKNPTKGANSKTKINPATDNLKDFEKAWKQDEQGSN